MSARTSATTTLRDLLDIPDSLGRNAFVVQLTEDVERPDGLLRHYAITPNLTDAYRQVLELIDSALRDKTSAGAYIHGSFGSGKSHFMAVLSLMLAGHPAPWNVPELHAVLDDHAWLRNASEHQGLLLLHFHMTGAASLEDKLFTRYLEVIGERHPDAPIAPIFDDEALFENADQLRATLGDDAFFAPLNATDGTSSPGASAWGALARTASWDAARYDAARHATDLDERARLFSVLVKTHFTSFASNRSAYVELDRGLALISEHAADLGYTGIVFFLDELILWLASRAADRVWLNETVPKVAKLIESQSPRAIPFVSLIARQRSLTDMVGEDLGADVRNLQTQLEYWEGRFATISLEDTNLPAIIEKRVVRPKSPDTRAELHSAFEQMVKKAKQRGSWNTLLGQRGKPDDFARIYPFTPALVEALVQLSTFLQRNRTAIKILNELLVEHLEDFQLGKAVPVGDLYDVLAASAQPMDGTMRARFDRARALYEHELLPVIRKLAGTDTPEACQRLRDDHRVRLGCSNCPQPACRRDNRLIKTLILAALLPRAPAFDNLTAKRLTDLNESAIQSPIPGREAADAVVRLREIASHVGKLRLGDQRDPSTAIVLEGVDLNPILQQGQVYATLGAQKLKLRDLLYAQLGLDTRDHHIDHDLWWKGSRRRGHLRFGNVREMSHDQLEAEPGADYCVVIDYPFDEGDHTPREDERNVEHYLETHAEGSPSVVWLPSFFSQTLIDDLRDLVVFESLLENRNRDLSSLSSEDQHYAEIELQNRAQMKRQRIIGALSAAYGVSQTHLEDLDEARSIDRHFHTLVPGATIRGVVVANLHEALRSLVTQLLEQRFPRHPAFGRDIRRGDLKKALAQLEALCDAPGRRRDHLGRAELDALRPAETLGLVTLSDTTARVAELAFRDLDKHLAARGLDAPSVAQLRTALDPEGVRGLQRDVQDFLMLSLLAVTNRQLQRDGEAVGEASLGKLADDLTVVRLPMPSPQAFEAALARAGELFGISLGSRALNARNLQALVDKLRAARKAARSAGADQIADLLRQRAEHVSSIDSARVRTADSVTELLRDVLGHDDAVAMIEALADYTPQTSARAVARHLTDAAETVRALQDDVLFSPFGTIRGFDREDARDVWVQVSTVLSSDELSQQASKRLRELSRQAQAIIADELKQPPPPPIVEPTPGKTVKTVTGTGTAKDELERLFARAREAFEQHGESFTLTIQVTQSAPASEES